jgi:hypothetical protein
MTMSTERANVLAADHYVRTGAKAVDNHQMLSE